MNDNIEFTNTDLEHINNSIKDLSLVMISISENLNIIAAILDSNNSENKYIIDNYKELKRLKDKIMDKELKE